MVTYIILMIRSIRILKNISLLCKFYLTTFKKKICTSVTSTANLIQHTGLKHPVCASKFKTFEDTQVSLTASSSGSMVISQLQLDNRYLQDTVKPVFFE